MKCKHASHGMNVERASSLEKRIVEIAKQKVCSEEKRSKEGQNHLAFF